MKDKDQILLEKMYELVIESSVTNYAKDGIVFLTKGKTDLGCCIGVKHGKSITVSKDLIERINKIPNLKFYAEGNAGENHSAEPDMIPFLQQNFAGRSVETDS